jgi:hypothetical protein
MNPVQIDLVFVAQQLGVVVISAVVTFFLTTLLPNNIRDNLYYSANRIKKRVRNPRVSLTWATSYELKNRAPLEEIQEEIQSDISTAPGRAGETFESTERTEYGNLTKLVTLSSENSTTPPAFAGHKQEQATQQVHHIRVKIELDPQYKNVRRALELLNSRDGQIRNAIAHHGIEIVGSSVTCSSESPMSIDMLFTQPEVQSYSANLTNSLEMEMFESKVRIRNLGGAEQPDFYDMVQEVITRYV